MTPLQWLQWAALAPLLWVWLYANWRRRDRAGMRVRWAGVYRTQGDGRG